MSEMPKEERSRWLFDAAQGAQQIALQLNGLAHAAVRGETLNALNVAMMKSEYERIGLIINGNLP